MDRSRRSLKPKVYSQPKRKCATISREELALVYVSSKANRIENRNLAIGRNTYFPNGKIPKDGKTRHFKCSVRKCNARATITLQDLNKLGVCKVRAANEHNHPPRDSGVLQMSDDDMFTEEDEAMMNRLLCFGSGPVADEPNENDAALKDDPKTEE